MNTSLRKIPRVLLPALLLLAPPAMPGQAPRRPTPAAVEEIREQLRQRQAERQALAERQELIPWRQLALSPDQQAGSRSVLVRLSNTMNFYRAVWTFTPEAGNLAAPVRLLLCWRGEQWIALPPGRWQATVALGRADSVRAFRIPVAPIEVRRGQVYELALSGAVEQAVSAMEAAAQKRSAERGKWNTETERNLERMGHPKD